MWPLIAMGGLSLLQQGQAAKSAAQQARERAIQSQAESKAMVEANERNFTATTFRLGLLNVQKAQEVRALEQRRFESTEQEQQVLGTAAVNAAASGTIGASVDAVRTDIEMAFDKVRNQITEENELNTLNYNTALYDLITGSQDQTQFQAQFRKAPKGAGMLGMLGNAAMSVAGTYLMAKMDLGLGPTPQTAGTTMTG